MSLDSVTHVSGISVTYVLGCSEEGKNEEAQGAQGGEGLEIRD